MRPLVAVCTIAASVLLAVAARAEKPADDVRPEEHAGSRKGGASFSTSSAFGNALRLARMLNDERVVASLLSARAMSPGATKEELAEMVDALETLGEPDQAARLLEQRLLRFPSEDDTLSQLAGLLTRSGRAKDASRVWRRVEARIGVYGMNTTQVDDYARVLSRTGMQDAAFRLLKAARPTASDDVREFWEDLGALAWQMEDTSEALIAYRKLWSLHAHPRGVAERLMVLAHEAGAIDEAIAIGVDDFRTNATPSSLLYAAQLQSDKGDWNMVQRTLSLGDNSAALFARSEQYWTLRGEAYSHLGDSRRARESFRAAVALNPGSTTAKNALLWDAIDREDHEALARYVDQWRTSVENEGVSWAAYALALDKLGRMHEALRFYAGELTRNPTDYLTMLEFVDALERTGDASRAERMRRFAVGKVRGEALLALRKPNPSPEERSLSEQTLLSTRKLLGAQINERWLNTMLAARGGSDAESASFLIDWCLSDDRVDCARNVLLRDRGQHASQPKWRAFRLQLAVADGDYTAMKDLLVNPSGLDPNDRIEALIALEKDEAAAALIIDGLDRNPIEARDTWRQRLTEIRARHAPNAQAGGSYGYIGSLDVFGPNAGAAHDVGPARLIYSAFGRQMTTRDGSLLLNDGVQEGDAFGLARFTTLRGVSEVGVGANFQKDTPLPRATVFDERLIRAGWGSTLRVAVNDPIEDTSLLRVAAAKYLVEFGLRNDQRFGYAQLDLHVREDHTRQLHHLGTEIGEVVEAGYKVSHVDPEWDVGVQALAHQRQNVTELPADISVLVPASARRREINSYLPPSYELLSIVTHLIRGDFLERYRPDRTSFPRYECMIGAGVLLPDLDGAFEAECSASILVSRSGYLSVSGYYDRGVFGIFNQTNAQASMNYTQTF